MLRRGRCLVVVWSLLRCYVVALLCGCVVVKLSSCCVFRGCKVFVVVVVSSLLPRCRSSCVVAWALLRGRCCVFVVVASFYVIL